jgi:hypothetical protein
VYTVTAAVVLVQPEGDKLHVVLQQGGNHTIAESPSPSCDIHARPVRRQQMRIARSHVRLCARARVTAVAFFDFPHGQTRGRSERDRVAPDPAFLLPQRLRMANGFVYSERRRGSVTWSEVRPMPRM